MPKKVTSSKRERVLNVDGEPLAPLVAKVFHTYYLAFRAEGFDGDQAFKLTQQMADFYLNHE